MKSILTEYQKMVDRLPTSARAIIMFAFLGVVVMVWYYMFWQKMQHSIFKFSNKIEVLNVAIEELREDIKLAKEVYESKKTALDDKKKERHGLILSPEQTKTALHDILMANKHLLLIELKNAPPSEAVLPNSKTRIFEHGIVIRFLGDYFSAMKYLQTVEKMSWDISWDRFEYRVIEYPIAEITIFIHTRSHEDEWIHV